MQISFFLFKFQITNVIHKTHPLIIHGDESNKLMLNYLGNYIGKAWSADFGCRDCSAQRVNFLKVINLCKFLQNYIVRFIMNL